ncbi:beta-1,4-N-acetylgalactosamyltransferase [Helicobacter pylori Hp P-1]|nr:beta-1,4-N-acetylgalactosamyltransferase [Helicobacter pylori Hp P-1]
MGLKNKIKGFVKERMPFVMRCVRGFKGQKTPMKVLMIGTLIMESIMKLRKC